MKSLRSLNPLFLRWLSLASVVIVSLGTFSCASVLGVRGTTYADGFEVVTVFLGLGQGPAGPISGRVRDPNSITGWRNTTKEGKTSQPIVLSNVHKVEARLRWKWGIGVGIIGLPDGANPVTVTIKHPPTRQPNGQVRSVVQRTEKIESMNAKGVWGFAYSYDRPEELMPGVWEFTLQYRDKVIYTDKITVVVAKDALANAGTSASSSLSKP